VKPAPFTYHRPGDVADAVTLLAELGADGKVLAGGQSLVPLMSMRLVAPAHLVDVNHLRGLADVEVTADQVRVGALVRHSALEHDRDAFAAAPLLRQVLQQVAHPTIRNRGTTVGSLVHGDPAAELPAVLLLLDGTLELRSVDGTRVVRASELFLGPLQTDVRPGELALAATFRRPPHGSGTAFVEVARRHGDYALCGVGAVVTTDADGAVTSARVALVSVAPVPVLVDVTQTVAGSGGGFERARLAALVDAAIEPEADIHASADYRRRLAHVLAERALDAARDEASRSRRARRAA
jgi:carbon-monoxide dehydrogenase medium subunit